MIYCSHSLHTAPAVVQRKLPRQRTTHVSCKIEDVVAAFDNLLAVLIDSQVYKMELITKDFLLQGKIQKLRSC